MFQPTTFTDFHQNWLVQLSTFLQPLQALSSPPPSNPEAAADHDDRCLALVDAILDHYVVFFDEKSKACRENPILMLTTPWLTPHERALSWFSGFRPTVVFPIAKKALGQGYKREKLAEMRITARIQERELENAIAGVERSLSRVPMISSAVQGWKREVVLILESANVLRETTATKLLEIMTPHEAVKFFFWAVVYTEGRDRGSWQRPRELIFKVTKWPFEASGSLIKLHRLYRSSLFRRIGGC